MESGPAKITVNKVMKYFGESNKTVSFVQNKDISIKIAGMLSEKRIEFALEYDSKISLKDSSGKKISITSYDSFPDIGFPIELVEISTENGYTHVLLSTDTGENTLVARSYWQTIAIVR